LNESTANKARIEDACACEMTRTPPCDAGGDAAVSLGGALEVDAEAENADNDERVHGAPVLGACHA
jgi:hypothetical protein